MCPKTSSEGARKFQVVTIDPCHDHNEFGSLKLVSERSRLDESNAGFIERLLLRERFVDDLFRGLLGEAR
jgi:hypothetical protein